MLELFIEIIVKNVSQLSKIVTRPTGTIILIRQPIKLGMAQLWSIPGSPCRYNVCIGQAEDRKFFRKLSLDCLVLDEGHMLKNMNSLPYTHLMKIQVCSQT